MPQIAAPVTDEERQRMSDTAEDIYDRRLKAILEPEYNGKIVAIHIDTEDYEVGRNSPEARFALRHRHPDGMIVTSDIGAIESFNPLAPWLRADKGWQGDIKTIPDDELDALIIAAAEEAAEDYRTDPELRAFHALDGEDFVWHE